ncbi:ABC transporter ATP-binding protein [Tindallia californiensis]|uniref:ATP-binding cassette, subfamily B n=1 Tax=Tindallia californiensis TaxID=159292 RepID=A0A1H3MQJ8_9FIRM|nr:ABC transporter ATP-binding protein [Tindallia californiensis]SDY78780.1 ATP-binding cassette, subfamily B [Tindallia californiensis]
MRGGFIGKYPDQRNKKFQQKYFRKENWQFIFPIIQKNRKDLFLAAFFTILYTIAFLFPPYLIQKIIDDYILSGHPSGMTPWIILFFLLYASSWYFAYQQRVWSQSSGHKTVFEIREALHKKLLELPISFHEKQKKGTLTSLLMNDVSALSSVITEGIIGLMSDVLTIIGITVIMYQMQPQLALLLLASVPIILLLMSFLGRHIREAFTNVREKMADLSAQVEENVSGIRAIQSLGIQEKSEAEFEQVSLGNFKAKLKAMMFLALLFPLMSLTTGVGNALLVWHGGLEVIAGSISIGIFAAFLAYIRKFYLPLKNFSDVYYTYLSALVSLNRIVDVMLLESHVKQPRDTPCFFQHRILFHRLCFYYDSKMVLKNLSMEIGKGERVGIVGDSGSGKSTLVRLLTKLDQPTSGYISFDECPIQEISDSIFRKMVAVIPQNIFLFADTIHKNILQGSPQASFEEVQQAAKKAQAHDMIMSLPLQYETVLGERGVGLSGGQRQLIAFSRALLKNPDILILDEATSSMDVLLENQLYQSMTNVFKNRTVLIIAHRLRTLQEMDKIFLLRDGSIADCGNHYQLLSRNNYYKNLVEAGFKETSQNETSDFP